MEGLDRFGRFVNRRELRALAGRLEEDERPLAVVEAVLDKPGVLAATDRRILFVRRRLIGTRLQAWPYRAGMAVTAIPGVDRSTVRLSAPRLVVEFAGVRKEQAKDFAKAVASRPGAPLDFGLPADEAERRARLKRLDRMLARGSVTPAEYERSKRALAGDDKP